MYNLGKMKRLLTILILIFTLQTPSQADDIRDFQIEGISIGDSLLDLFSEKKIKNNLEFFYDNNKFISFMAFSRQVFVVMLILWYKAPALFAN